jgi:D-3-phosphoglycerate dehydrogenase
MTKPKYSFPKERIKVLILENIHQNAATIFSAENYQIEVINKALTESELASRLKDVSVLCIRSGTKVTEKSLKNADRLLAIGAFCIGTNQIDLDAATKRGIAVFNAPFSNSRSVVELAIGEIIALNRRLADKSRLTHDGVWDKSATGAHEIRGLKLGIVGYGNIGSQLSVLAENLGMSVYFYDLQEKLALGNARSCSTLKELLQESDVITVHVDGRAENKNLIGEEAFRIMKKGALFLNLSRGSVVDLDALKKHIVSGHLAGAAIDVYPEEPNGKAEKFDSVLRDLPNVIMTPHIAGSTEEAQASIGTFVADKIINFINKGATALSVNLPKLALPLQTDSHRLILIHKNVPGVLARVNTLLASKGVNISGQYLGTKEEVGYVITDINADYPDDTVSQLKNLPETIRLRVMY